MANKVKAVYQRGVFVPEGPCDVPEGSEVELIIHSPLTDIEQPIPDIEQPYPGEI